MPDYPRQLHLDDQTEQELITFLNEELTQHYMERGVWLENLIKWQKDYWAEPLTKQNTFPFTGASNLVIPLTAIALEAVHARSMTTLFGLSQFVSCKAVSGQWADVVRPMETFFDHELLDIMKVRKPINDIILEQEKFGTGIGKVGYEKLTKTAIKEIAGEEQEFDVVVKDGAVLDAVACGRFLMPFAERDPQTSLWCGEEHSSTFYAIQQMEYSGMVKEGTAERLKAYINGSALMDDRKFEEAQEKLEGREPGMPTQIGWHEIWMSFNVDNDPKGRTKEIVVLYHRDSQSLMSVRYNYRYDLSRPYRVGVYFPVEHRWTGIGICKQNEQFMREITTLHRQRLDNGTLANMRMIKISKLSGYGPNEPIFPGKMWFLDDMDHLEPFQLSEIYPSDYNNEQASLVYSQQRTGVNEVTLGMPQVGTPGTATSDLARIQEGNKKFDFTYSNTKELINLLVQDTACAIQQYGPRDIAYFENAENGAMVQQFFQMPEQYIRDGLLITIKASGQHDNKLIDRSNWQQVSQIMQQYYTELNALAAQMGDPMMIQLLTKYALQGSTEVVKQILESFDLKNIDRILPLREIAQVINAQQQSIPAGPQTAQNGGNGSSPASIQGGNSPTNGTGGAEGMGDVNAFIRSLGAGGV